MNNSKLIYNPAKSYNGPFWVMLFVSLILTLGCIGVYITQQRINMADSQKHLNFNGWLILWPVLFFAETVMYRRIRRNIKKISYVWLHISTVVFSFIILPILVVVITISITDRKSLASLVFIKQAQRLLFWLLFITGHAFFIATIAKSFAKRKTADDEATPGVLDGIVDEY